MLFSDTLVINIINLFSKYLIPIYFIIGSAFNCINTIVFSSINIQFQTSTFQYLKINSIIDSFNLLILCASSLELSVNNFDYFYTYWYKCYQIYIVLYLSRVLNMMSSLINIQIAINRYILSKKHKFKRILEDRTRIKANMFAFFIFSAIYHIPNLLFNKIVANNNVDVNSTQVKNESEYTIQLSETVKKRLSLEILLCVLPYLMTFSNFSLMITLSILTHKNHRRDYNRLLSGSIYSWEKIVLYKKSKDFYLGYKVNSTGSYKKANRSEHKTSMMVLWITIIFIINELVAAVGCISRIFIKDISLKLVINSVSIFVTVSYITSCTLNTFLYHKFSKEFAIKLKKVLFCRKELKNYFKK